MKFIEKYWWAILLVIAIVGLTLFFVFRPKDGTPITPTLPGTGTGSAGGGNSTTSANNVNLTAWNALSAQQKIKLYGSTDVRDYMKTL